MLWCSALCYCLGHHCGVTLLQSNNTKIKQIRNDSQNSITYNYIMYWTANLLCNGNIVFPSVFSDVFVRIGHFSSKYLTTSYILRQPSILPRSFYQQLCMLLVFSYFLEFPVTFNIIDISKYFHQTHVYANLNGSFETWSKLTH